MDKLNEQEANQEVFDRAWNHILKQGKKSITVNEDGQVNCVYKSENGLSCAFAPCIKEYNPILENKSAFVLFDNGYSECLDPVILNADPDFCSSVQYCHDGAPNDSDKVFINDFKRRMIKLAKEKDLKISDPTV